MHFCSCFVQTKRIVNVEQLVWLSYIIQSKAIRDIKNGGYTLKKLLSLLIILLFVLLTACTSTSEEATAVSPTTLPPTEMPLSTVPPSPAPTEIPATAEPPPTVTAVATEPGLPAPPTVPEADEITFDSEGGHIAFVQNEALYIQDLARDNPPVLIDDCTDIEFCGHHFLKWSPDGQYLLYYRTEDFVSEIRLATPQGEWQTIGTEAHFFHPAAWSPDGSQIAYLRDTGEMVEADVLDDDGEVMTTLLVPQLEVMTVDLQTGLLTEPRPVGLLNLDGEGCGGGGRSPSEVLYEEEGGTSYGYIMGVLEWTAQDILLFTTNCTNVGIGRYDMAAATQLDPFDIQLRNLVLSPDKTVWYAVSGNTWASEPGNNELVTGDPEDTAVTTIPTSNPVEMAFIGNQSGSVYVTSRVLIGEDDTDNTMGGTFRFYETTLWQVDAESGEETAVHQADDHAVAKVQEAPDGTLLFVRIENDIPLAEAVKAGVLQERWPTYMPKRHIVALGEAGEILYLVPDAGSPAVTP